MFKRCKRVNLNVNGAVFVFATGFRKETKITTFVTETGHCVHMQKQMKFIVKNPVGGQKRENKLKN